MTLNEYQKAAMKTAVYPDYAMVLYPLLALNEEIGELTGNLAKLADRDARGVIVGEGDDR